VGPPGHETRLLPKVTNINRWTVPDFSASMSCHQETSDPSHVPNSTNTPLPQATETRGMIPGGSGSLFTQFDCPKTYTRKNKENYTGGFLKTVKHNSGF